MTPTNLTECLAWLDEVKSKNGGPASEEYVRRDMGRATPRFAEFVASRVAECLRGHLQGEAIFGTNIPAPDPSPPKNCMAIGCTASSKPWGEGEAIKAPAPALKMGFDMEVLAEAVHEAYLTTCARLGWHVKEANRVPYSELSEDSKELARASVRAVLASLPAPAPTASANTIPEWWPECPYPESVFPLKTEALVRLIPDPAQRTSISGYYGRLFWNIASKAIFDSWKFNRDFDQEAAPGAAPTTEKGGEGVSLSQFENSEIINPALDEACDLIMRERDEQMHREWQRAERQLEKRIAIVSRFRTKKYMAQLRDLMDEVRVIHCQFVKTTGKAEKQKSEYPALKWEWVDQYENGGYSGDSYAGYIYLEVKPGRFLRLQYST